MKQEVEIFDDENLIVINDEVRRYSLYFYPEQKKYECCTEIKDDCLYYKSIYEYKISIDPLELKFRLIDDLVDAPNQRYFVKDCVVYESEIVFKRQLATLKKIVEWHSVDILCDYVANLYILSKHPEIIQIIDYRKFLRQNLERLKLGESKILDAIKNDSHNLQIQDNKYDKYIWYQKTEAYEKEWAEYSSFPEEQQKGAYFEKKLEYIVRFNDSLFNPESPTYAGISKQEFTWSKEMMRYIEVLLGDIKVERNKSESGDSKWRKRKLLLLMMLIVFVPIGTELFFGTNPFLVFVCMLFLVVIPGLKDIFWD